MHEPAGKTIAFYTAMARGLTAHGVDTMFGLIGDANLYMADSFVRDCGGRFVSAAHEASAVLMALGYSQVTGKVGVATVTHGPGVTNTLTALIEGVKGTTPIVLLAGDTAVADKDNFQNVPQREHILATGAGFAQLRTPATLGEDMATAFRRAEVERRPIVLNSPADFQWQEVEYRHVPYFLSEHRAVVPESTELDNAVGIIAAARGPIVLAGRGACDARSKAALIRLAERIGAPLATTLKARGLFRGEPFDLGVFGTLSTDVAAETIGTADCVVAFGAGLNKYTAGHGAYLDGKRVIQINLEREEVGRTRVPDAGIVGDPALTADRIVELLDMAEIPPSAFRSEALKTKIASDRIRPYLSKDHAAGTVDIRTALIRLEKEFPSDRVVVQDGGRFMMESWKVFHAPDPRSYVHTVNSACIGLGMGQAIGAAVAAKDRPTVLITGDGGFMLGGLTEFSTAVRQKLDLVVIVCNDNGYGAEYIQFRRKGMDPSLSLLNWPDLAPVAMALGGQGVTVRSQSDLETAAAAITARKSALLIDLKLDPESLSAITF
jgi:thiamine pyrophosphate-dependent acetolactate synthase large subunit-like protein